MDNLYLPNKTFRKQLTPPNNIWWKVNDSPHSSTSIHICCQWFNVFVLYGTSTSCCLTGANSSTYHKDLSAADVCVPDPPQDSNFVTVNIMNHQHRCSLQSSSLWFGPSPASLHTSKHRLIFTIFAFCCQLMQRSVLFTSAALTSISSVRVWRYKPNEAQIPGKLCEFVSTQWEGGQLHKHPFTNKNSDGQTSCLEWHSDNIHISFLSQLKNMSHSYFIQCVFHHICLPAVLFCLQTAEFLSCLYLNLLN